MREVVLHEVRLGLQTVGRDAQPVGEGSLRVQDLPEVADPPGCDPAARSVLDRVREPFAEVGLRVPGECEVVDVFGSKAGDFQAISDRAVGEAGVVLEPREALLLDGRDELAVDDERGGRVAVISVDPQDVHVCRVPRARNGPRVHGRRVSFPVMEPVRTTILTSIMAPHRISLFNALASFEDIDLSVIYLARSDPSRRWPDYEDEMRFRHLILREHARIRRGEAFVHVNSGLLGALRSSRPHALVAGGWYQLAHHEAYALRRSLRTRFLWWVESNQRDLRPESASLRRLKRSLIGTADGVVVPGRASAAYVRTLGARSDRVWIAPNAVDNDFYRSRATDRRGRVGPVRFLFAGRLEPTKGLAYLLDAWSRVPGDAELAIAGLGSLDEAVHDRVSAAAMPPVRSLGHLDRDQLARAYAEADVFVFPSVSDPWGLVLNEAMASSFQDRTSAPGAVDDPISDCENGIVVPPFDPGALTDAMVALASDPARRLEMGEHSSSMIRDFEPQTWAEGMREAVLTNAPRGALR